MTNVVGNFKLQYSIVRELGFTPMRLEGAYFGQPRDDFRHLLVPSNRLLFPILREYFKKSKWNPVRL